MELEIVRDLVSRIHGVTFASLDTRTYLGYQGSIRCETEAERVLIYRTNGKSGYEAKVKRHLEEAGKNPDGFSVGTLPWGSRIEDLPLIENKGLFYLQYIQLAAGKKTYFIGNTDVEVSPLNLGSYGVHNKQWNVKQDLPEELQVQARCINVNNILKLVMLGEEVFDTNVAQKGKRSILKIAAPKDS